jgi:hypothetical protein
MERASDDILLSDKGNNPLKEGKDTNILIFLPQSLPILTTYFMDITNTHTRGGKQFLCHGYIPSGLARNIGVIWDIWILEL